MKKSIFLSIFLFFGPVLIASENSVQELKKETLSIVQPVLVTENVAKQDLKPVVDNTRIAIAIAAGYFTAYFFTR